MGKVSIKTVCALVFLLCVVCSPSGAQMTRNQLLKKYYQITNLQESGKYAEAIALCEEISIMYPKLPDPYLRMARIYDDAGERSLALLMYRQYVDMEMDDETIAEYLPRIRELELMYNIPVQDTVADFSIEVSDTVEVDIMTLAMSAEQIPDEESVVGESVEMLEFKYDNTQRVEIEDIKDLRNTPFRAVSLKNVLEKYGMDKEQEEVSFSMSVESMTSAYVGGKWISSIDDEDDGREHFILSFFTRGSVVEVTIDENSGLFHQSKNVISVSWKTIQSMWTPVSKYFDFNELKGNTASGSIKDNQLSFSFDFQKKKKTDYVKLSKNILSCVSTLIPFGSFVSKLSDSIFSYLQDKQSTVTFQTVLKFDMRPVTDNVMNCTYTICERQTSNGKDKEVLIERKQCRFYRCPDDYSCFVHESEYQDNLLLHSVYTKLQSEAEKNIDMNFPLAYLNFYGIGTEKNLPLAMGRMQILADRSDCNRARYWLASICYNLSLDEERYPLRSTRKKFRTKADRMISDMQLSEFKYAYGLQGDVYSGGNTNTKRAIACYERGAQEGDPYCFYQLGMAYYSGQIIERNPEKAYSFFQKAAELGYPDAFEQLAICCRNGMGVKQDYGLYISYLYEAIRRGSIDAIKELYHAYCCGVGVACDFEKAIGVKEIYYCEKGDVWKGVLQQYGINTELSYE